MVDIAYVAYLWRPTANNRRFAMSDEIAQDDDGGFDMGSFGGSLDEEDARSPTREDMVNGGVGGGAGGASRKGDLSPVPPKPVSEGAGVGTSGASKAQRSSLDGETIFAVGEDGDRWSDEESPRHSEEKQKLTG